MVIEEGGHVEQTQNMDKTVKPRNRIRKTAAPYEDTCGQVAHTLTACVRCRHRKTRCDPGLPRCTPCQKNNALCEYFDAAKGKKMPRNYVVHLQERVRQLECELASLKVTDPPTKHNIDSVERGVSVRIKEGDEYPRFLGPASGIAMTRLVLEMARDLWDAKGIREIITEQKHLELKAKYQNESIKPTSKVYPLISFVAAPGLPSQELTEQLVQNYNLKAQYLYPVLHEPTFNSVVRNVYNGSRDPYENFAVRLVIAISMQKLDSTYAGLADSYYLAALPFLDQVLIKKNLGTLQCLILIAMYSTTTPTRTAAYWVVGLATKLAQELRIMDEATIEWDENNQLLDPLEIDMRRRCYWIGLSFELGLAHILGRPSSFAITYDHVDVKPWLLVDDINITHEGVKPGSPAVMKKRISSHFMLMRLLQLEIRHVLYVRKSKIPASDADPWFAEMEKKLYAWMDAGPRQDEGSGLSETWFRARLNTMLVFLFRPSPQVPEPSINAAEKCFEASRYNIYIQKQQIETKSIDVTWIFGQALFMAINTILWTLSYPRIREIHPKAEVEQHLQKALEAIYLVSLKWPGVESALELYTTLADTCLKAYEHDIKPALPVFNTVTPPPAYPPYSTVTAATTSPSHSTPQTHVQSQTQPNISQYLNQIPQATFQPPVRISVSPPLQSPSQHSSGSSLSNVTPPSIPAQISQRQSRDSSPGQYGSPTSSIASLQYSQQPTSNPYQQHHHQKQQTSSGPHSFNPAYTNPYIPINPAIDREIQSTATYSNPTPLHHHPVIPKQQQQQQQTPPPSTTSHQSPTTPFTNQAIFHNPLPDLLTYGFSTANNTANIWDNNSNNNNNNNHFYGSLCDPYAQLLHAEYFDPGQLKGLNLEQQSELLGTLEASGLNASGLGY